MSVINLNTINHKTTNHNLASLAINDPMKIPEFSSPSIYHWIFAFWASSTWVMSFNKETCCSLKVVESSFPINWLSIDLINSLSSQTHLLEFYILKLDLKSWSFFLKGIQGLWIMYNIIPKRNHPRILHCIIKTIYIKPIVK